MGLDTVELVMDAEDTFGITISDAEAQRAMTAGGLCELIRAKLVERQGEVCLTAATFYRIRRALAANDERARLRPSSPTLPEGDDARAAFKAIEKSTGYRMPHLSWSNGYTGAVMGTLVAMIALVIAGARLHRELLGYAGLMLVAVYWMIEFAPGKRLGNPCRTLGGLTRVVLARNLVAIANEHHGVNDAELWQSVRVFIAEWAGVDPQVVQPDSNLVTDFD